MDNEHNNALVNKLILPNKGLVMSTIYKKCRYPGDAEDLYQDTLLNFCRNMHTYNPEKGLNTWLICIVQRLVHRSDQKQYGRQIVDYVDPDKLLTIARGNRELVTTPSDPFFDEIDPELTSAFENIKPIYREAFLLHLKGMTNKDIMKKLHDSGSLRNPNIETVRSRIYLCRKQLQKLLADWQKRQ